MVADVPACLGRFRLLDELGRGGMGVVYRAFDSDTSETVVVKVLHPDLASDPTYVARFLREAKNAQRVEHPNIVRVLDADREDGIHYLAMEFVAGADLEAILKAKGALPVRLALRIAADVAEAVEAIAAVDMAHRDIKPANIIATVKGQVKLADFGLAKRNTESDDISIAGLYLGTPFYMAPEVFAGQPASFASDVYALGAMLYELLVGEAPYAESTTVEELIQARFTKPVPRPRDRRQEIPAAVNELVEQLLQRAPAMREVLRNKLASRFRELLSAMPHKGESSFLDTTDLALTPSIRCRVQEQNRDGRTVRLDVKDRLPIGRHPDNALQLMDLSVARVGHAYFDCNGTDLVVRKGEGDVFVNGIPACPEGSPLQAGDLLKIGSTTVLLLEDEKESQVLHAYHDFYRNLPEGNARISRGDTPTVAVTDLEAAQLAYDRARPWQWAMETQVESAEHGPASIAAIEALVERGHSPESAECILADVRESASDLISAQDVLSELPDFLGMPCRGNEISLLLRKESVDEKLASFDWEGEFRYKGQRWRVLKRKLFPATALLYLRLLP